MRFDQINIPAFGPFTDFQIEFEKSEYDIHLIHGPNEAGKSSLLRAIRGLLYGIPNTTSIKNTAANTNTLTFDGPVLNPVLIFSSIGNPGTPVPIDFGKNL